MTDSPSETAFADLVVEFLDAATHQILYHRGIYPERVFTRCSKFGVPLLRSEHPWVNQFVADHLRSVHEMAASCSAVRHIDIAVLSNSKGNSNSSGDGTAQNSDTSEKKQNRGSREDTAECYAFRFDRPPAFDASQPSGLGAIEASFRAMLLKLNSALASLPKLGGNQRQQNSQDPSFTFRIHSTAAEAAAMRDDLRWAETPSSIAAHNTDINSDSDDCKVSGGKNCEIVPVCAMKRPFELQISISLFS